MSAVDRAADAAFAVDPADGTMRCGYCHNAINWAGTETGSHTLTGGYQIAVDRETGRVVVLADARAVSGLTVQLPHCCESIPDAVLAEYSAEIAAARLHTRAER